MRRLALAFVLVTALAACGSSADRGGSASAPRNELKPGDAAGAPARPAKNGLTDVAVGRDVVRAGSLTVRVPDVADAARAAIRTAEAAGGFLESESTDAERTALTLRVPPDEFTRTADAVGRLGTVTDRTVTTEDVTSDVADVDGRLRAARASVARVRTLLNRATTISEITDLEAELNTREAALESLETRQRALAGKTAFASLTVTFTRPVEAAPAAKVKDAGFTSGLRAGWAAFVTTAKVLLVVAGALLPFAAVALVVIGVHYAVRRRRATARA